jgi:DNA mismatch repair protein MSH6
LEVDDHDEDFEDIKKRQAKRPTKKLKKDDNNKYEEPVPKTMGSKKIATSAAKPKSKGEAESKGTAKKSGKKDKRNLIESDGEKAEEKSDIGADFMKAFENADPETLKFSVNEEDPLPEWLKADKIRDEKMRPKNHPDYDPSTIYIPKEDECQFSPMFQQYWNLKRKIFDTILFLKFGNCYMIFFEDALTVRKELDLKVCFWGANRPCVTVMDSSLKKHTSRLLERGYKVSVAEQMETDDNKEGSIIRREITQILSKGTITDYDQGYASKFLLAVTEEENTVGLCLVDTTTHEFYLDQFQDDGEMTNINKNLL